MTRVLFINHSANIGGAETNLLNILRYAPGGGFQPVGVLLPWAGPLEPEIQKLGIDVGHIDYHAFRWRNPARYAQTLAQLLWWIGRTQPQVIHLNHQWLISHVAMAASLARRPLVCHTRNFLDTEFVQREGKWLRRSARILAVSGCASTRAIALGLSAEHVITAYDGLDLSRFEARAIVRKRHTVAGRRRTSATIGFCGRLVPEKGLEELVAATAIVSNVIPLVQLLIIGEDQAEGRFVTHLQGVAQDLGIASRVSFLGFRYDVELLLGTIDVLVVPSRTTMPEGLPLSVLEGLAAGCVVVATPNSGIPEAILEGETGFLVEPENPKSLADAIIRALTLSSHERERMQHNGRELVREQFSIQRQVTELGRLYSELLH